MYIYIYITSTQLYVCIYIYIYALSVCREKKTQITSTITQNILGVLSFSHLLQQVFPTCEPEAAPFAKILMHQAANRACNQHIRASSCRMTVDFLLQYFGLKSLASVSEHQPIQCGALKIADSQVGL